MSDPVKTLEVQSTAELADVVRGAAKSERRAPLRFVTGGTKPPLNEAIDGERQVSLGALRGIVAYDPAEYTITVRAGTRLVDLQQTLAERSQFLPFDPLLAGAGATIGGTVAAGLSGAGRAAWGGIRDYILEVRLVDGLGELVRGGGRVVKNAAGFDLPKLMVGSCGSFGPLVDVTLKVFPRPEISRTFEVRASAERGPGRAGVLLGEWTRLIAHKKLQPEACEFEMKAPQLADAQHLAAPRILLRFSGSELALERRLARVRASLEEEAGLTVRMLDDEEHARAWRDLQELRFADDGGAVAKIACSPGDLRRLADHAQPGVEREAWWISAAGHQAFIAASTARLLELSEKLPGLLPVRSPRGESAVLRPLVQKVVRPAHGFAAAVRRAMDPHELFA